MPDNPDDAERVGFLAMLAGVRWKGEVSDMNTWSRVNSLKNHVEALEEPTKSRSIPQNILVGCVVTPLWGDGWVPMKVINPTKKSP